MKKYIYVGGGFDPQTLIYLAPIIKGYTKNKKYNILIEKKDFYNFIKNLKKKNLKLQEYYNLQNIILFNTSEIRFKYIISVLLKIIKNIFFFYKLIFFFSYLDKKNLNSIFYHSFLDSCFQSLKEKNLKPNLYLRVKNLFKLLLVEASTTDIIKTYKINTVFLAHSVYHHRIKLEIFRKKKIKIFIHANQCIFRQPQNKDIEWSFISKKLFSKISKKFKKETINKFWKKRLSGDLDDPDYLKASKIKQNNKYITPNNVVFLHVFKDSPFASIDKKRIFFNYYHWIIETLKILKNSPEKWSIRIHPNAGVWGENSIAILDEIKKKYYNGKLPSNIVIDNKLTSNLNVFEKFSRCVTFNGTAGLEASCYGVKPIIIANNTLSELNKNYVIKPKTIHEYKKFLLKNSNDHYFKQDKKAIEESKILLFSVYNILTFRKDLNINPVFRKTALRIINQQFINSIKSVRLNFDKLFYCGNLLKNKKNRTLSFKYLDLLE